MNNSFIFSFILFVSLSACAQKKENKIVNNQPNIMIIDNPKIDTAILGNGCFWCTEAIFQQLEGVISATSGYSGGDSPNPTYKEVCTGTTGHAECLQVIYDSSVISFDELLEVFWKTHDPTSLNRQGEDVGTQYRSVVFYNNEEQKIITEKYIAELNKNGAYDKPIVTTLEKFEAFYPAEDYHKNYFNLNGEQPYCRLVVQPKVEKFEKIFKHKLKKSAP